jgi:hypothetical protein
MQFLDALMHFYVVRLYLPASHSVDAVGLYERLLKFLVLNLFVQ